MGFQIYQKGRISDNIYMEWTYSLVRGFGSVVKHSTADPGIASSIPPYSN